MNNTAHATPPATPEARIWSPAQQAVFAAVESDAHEHKHLVVEALAGSGKSTTLAEAIWHTPQGSKVLAMAFNKAIAADFASRRLPATCKVLTFHAYGLRLVTQHLGRREIDGDATMTLARHVLAEEGGGTPGAVRAASSWDTLPERRAICKLVGLAKNTLVGDAKGLDLLIDTYNIEVPEAAGVRERIIRRAQAVLALAAKGQGKIDFDDMIWLPVVRQLPHAAHDFVIVDEQQDMNACQMSLVYAAAGEGGRIIACGDRRQAIYGFRGANANGMTDVIRKLNAHVLPLNVTYRCASSIVAEAAALVPSIEAAPGAAAGTVRHATPETLDTAARAGDFVLSRTNAPLVSQCFRWLARGVRAAIRGRDIGAGLISWVKGTGAGDVPQLLRLLDQWEAKEVARLIAAERESLVEGVADRAACIRAISEDAGSVAEVVARIERLFADTDGVGCIMLSSTHRAKGLEADRVWLLLDTYRPKAGGEEANLLYVAVTRARHELVYVSAEEQKS